MLVFGNVINIDEAKARVKLVLPDYDNFETDWYFVPQMATVKDKSHNMIEQNTLVAACVSDGFEDGCIIGAIYNDEDLCILGDKNIKYIKFEDGSEVLYDKKEHFLNIKVEGDVMLNVKGDVDSTIKGNLTSTINGNLNSTVSGNANLTAANINSNGNFIHTGAMAVNGSITASGDISDTKGSMQEMRDTFNSHKNGEYSLSTGKMQ